MPKLRDLDAQFVRLSKPDGSVWEELGGNIAIAQGVMFGCPKCYAANGNTMVGTHQVVCWSRSRGVPDGIEPGPGRWRLDGLGIDDLTLNADPPNNARSVALNGGCAWHGFVTNGEAA